MKIDIIINMRVNKLLSWCNFDENMRLYISINYHKIMMGNRHFELYIVLFADR